ncbi:MAG: DMT family transporter [Acidobacteriia bacterium]|nr:DMT family transporter [Terriglobia bacterium]
MKEPVEQVAEMAGPRPAGRLMAPWMLLSLLTVALWGGWGLQSKIIVDRISPWTNQVLFSIGLLPLVLWMAFSRNLRRTAGSKKKGVTYGLITGLLGGTGNIAMYLALARGGKASIVIPFVGLAPLVTVVLALALLGESLNRAQIMGVGLALISIYLLSL